MAAGPNSTATTDAEFWVLTTDEGRALLAEVSAVPAPGPGDLTRWRKSAAPERVAAALRLADGRRRGAAKFSRADRMWFDPIGLEQATAEPVARHKAARFSRADVVVDICCGIGGDAVALAGIAKRGVIAVDRNPAMCRRALWNAAVDEVADRVIAVQGRAEAFDVPSGAWVHIDPDRRVGKARARTIDGYVPGLETLDRLVKNSPGGAIKLGPASDFAATFGDGFEVELVSLGGECKEATVWFGGAAGCRRRATCLPSGETWTDSDGPLGFVPVGEVDRFVFDPDAALVRAGLLDSFASAHGLWRFAAGVDYLTGAGPVDTPFLTAFDVQCVMPLDLKRLRKEVALRGIGTLEVKTKGVNLRPEEVRSRLRPTGPVSATLLLAGGEGPSRAVIAERLGNRR